MRLPDGYRLSTDKTRVDLGTVWHLLDTQAYWARWRSREDVEAQFRAAWRVVAAYGPDGATVAYARAVSDGLNFAYLADVIVADGHRARGVGRAVLAEMIDNGPGARFRWMLHTSDAHDLYRGFGFAAPDRTVMERPSKRT